MPSNYIGPGQSSFAMGPEELKRLNLFLGKFIGTHNFHNFTVQVRSHHELSSREAAV
jgi:tRNA U38,U39,U40 pseudouridine synthase TruA